MTSQTMYKKFMIARELAKQTGRAADKAARHDNMKAFIKAQRAFAYANAKSHFAYDAYVQFNNERILSS